MLILAMATGMSVALRITDKVNDNSTPGSSFIAAIFNVVFAFIAVLCDSSSCCCCCQSANRKANRTAEKQKQQLLSSDTYY